MNIVEIAPLSNGAHRNQDGLAACPTGWAVIPDGMETPSTYPFVNITVSDATPPVVLKMEAGTVPEPEPMTPGISAEDTLLDMAADYEERLCMLELNS
jgi:hypothetical protein